MNNRIDIKAGGYARASGYLNDANQLALMAYNHLSTDLAATGAMAGTDTTAADFATTYDQAAQATLSSIGDLVTALACLGIAIHTSLENHLHAEHSAAHSAARAGHTDNPSPVTDTQPLYAAGTWYDPIPATIPTSLGGDPTTLPGWANTVLDHIGGLVWPDADTTRLYTAATAYDTTATAVFDLTEHQHLAADHLTHQHSPEIPTALAEIDHTVQLTYQLSYRLTALARTCRTYAETVEEHRRQTLDLITDLLRDTAIFEAVGGLFDLVTGPVGTFVASDAALARISAKAPEFLRILDTLRDLTRTYTTALRALLDETRLLAPQLQRLTKLRLAQRTERGAIELGRSERRMGWLRDHEHPPGHLISRHVGKTDEELLARFAAKPNLKMASTFTDERAAEATIDHVLNLRSAALERWLASSQSLIRLEGPMNAGAGRCLDPAGRIGPPSSVRLILLRDPTMPEGFHTLTAYPMP